MSPLSSGSSDSASSSRFSTLGSTPSAMRSREWSDSPTVHMPSFVMPMGMTWYLSESRWLMMAPADTQEISCSVLRPP